MNEVSTESLRASLTNRTVLVIDDNEAVLTALDVLLSFHGVRVLTARGPEEGLAALARHEVELVIQDMNFRREATSGEEGIRLFREIRSRHGDVPIILLTAWTHLETAVELVKAGAADYIAKPWDDARLLTTVRNLPDRRSAQAETRAIERLRSWDGRMTPDSIAARTAHPGSLSCAQSENRQPSASSSTSAKTRSTPSPIS